MEVKVHSIVCLLLLTFCSYSMIGDAGADEDPVQEPCEKVMVDLLKKLLLDIGTCSRSMTFKSDKERAAKFHCILKCVAIDFQILTPEGILDKPTVTAFMENKVPAHLKEKAAPIIWECYDKSAGNLDPGEEFCKSYKPFVRCFMDALPNICKDPAKA